MADSEASAELMRRIGNGRVGAVHWLQATLLSICARLEVSVDAVLVSWFARDLTRSALLADAIGQLSIDRRVSTLRDIMEDEGWDDDFPFVLPVLKKLFEIRNRFAHAAFVVSKDSEGDIAAEITTATIRRGRVQRLSISWDVLLGLLLSGSYVEIDLQYLLVRSASLDYWGIVDGHDSRPEGEEGTS